MDDIKATINISEKTRMKVPIFDLKVEDDAYRQELLDAVDRMLKHGRIIMGPEVAEFEETIAREVGVKYAIGVSSGSSALYLALKSAGIGPGDEVITTPLTWIITLNAIAACGATPVCVDVRGDFNIDPERIAPAITKATKAILPVHYTGHMCDMNDIIKITEDNDLFIIEDAAQAYGGMYHSKMAGSFSKAAGFSLNPMKTLAGFGEGGIVTTDDSDINEQVRILRHAGTKSDPKKSKITNECYYVALNHKIDTVQAALLLVSLKRFPARLKRKTEIAQKYKEGISEFVTCPQTPEGDRHAYFTYSIQTDQRDKLREHLTEWQIENKIFHLPLASHAPVFSHLKKYDTPVAQKCADEYLNLPAHEKLTDEQVDYVINVVRGFFKNGHGS